MPRNFPWPKPERLVPLLAELNEHDYARLADVLEWFLRAHGGDGAPPNSPIARWGRQLRGLSSGGLGEWVAGSESAGLTAGRMESPRHLAAAADIIIAMLAAHSIQVIQGAEAHGGPRLAVDASFVRHELARPDTTTPNAPAMPASFLTLLVAARAAMLGGRSLRIFGNQSKGLDVEWIGHDPDERLRFECKLRAFSRAFDATATANGLMMWSRQMMSGTNGRAPGRALRRRSRDERVRSLDVVVIGGLVPRGHAEELVERRDDYKSEIEGGIAAAGLDAGERFRETLPHSVMALWYGIDHPGPVAHSHYLDFPEAAPAAPDAARRAWEHYSERRPERGHS